MSFVRIRVFVVVGSIVAGCTTIPDARFSCDTTADCPPDFSCSSGLCYRAAVDSGIHDAAPPDTGPDGSMRQEDSGVDASMCVVGTNDHCAACGDVCSWSECASGECNDGLAAWVGEDHACVVREREGIVCWGSNDSGQLGDGTEVNSETLAVSVRTDDAFTAVTGGGSLLGTSFSCALSRSGIVSCWGSDLFGMLGNGNASSENVSTPAAVQLVDRATHISTGDFSTCARLRDGSVHCWGRSPVAGESSAAAPRRMFAANAEEVSVGDQHACVRMTGGTVQCWGYNGSGQLGDGTNDDSLTAVNVALSGVTQIAARGDSTCAIVGPQHEVWCWGFDHGSTPTAAGVVGAELISVGPRGTLCAVRDGDVFCWGASLGSAEGDYPDATPIAGIPSAAVSMSVSGTRACAVVDSGDVFCWGGVPGGGPSSATLAPIEQIR